MGKLSDVIPTSNFELKRGLSQRSIFDFTRTEIAIKDESVNQEVVMDEGEVIEFKQENGEDSQIRVKEEETRESLKIEESCLFPTIDLKQEIKQETNQEEDVSCPVCDTNISSLDIRSRTDHVDTCLVKFTFVEDEEESSTSSKRKSSTSSRGSTPTKEKNSSTTKEAKSPRNKKRKVVKEKIRYINSTTSIRKTEKIIKPPPSTTPSAPTISNSKFTRREIIPLKIMTFPIDESKNLKYRLSVDAFNFAPHEIINQYFLTHFHADHYGGISKKWAYERVFKEDTDYEDDSKYKKIIYCTVITGKLLTLYFSIDSKFIKHLEMDIRYKIKNYEPDKIEDVEDGGFISNDESPGLYVTPLTANHCPGAGIFLFESINFKNEKYRILHCGDFRVNMEILDHPLLKPFSLGKNEFPNCLKIDKCYLDTTYMNPTYIFPKQELVCNTIAQLFEDLTKQENNKSSNTLFNTWFGYLTQKRITDFWNNKKATKKKKFLILVGTYVIGKERLAIAISKKLGCLIYVSNINNRKNKYEILKTYQDSYLDSVLTDDDLGLASDCDCIVHLVPMNIVGSIQELSNYFNHNKYYENFERCVGLRPTGWSFTQNGKQKEPPPIEEEPLIPKTPLSDIVKLMTEKTPYSSMDHILSQSPKTTTKKKPDIELYRIYSLPYSEHSSFRELSYFICFFNFEKVIPTVNCNNEFNLKRMDEIIEIWEKIRRIRIGGGLETDFFNVNDHLIEMIQNLSLDTF
ncbi:pso2 [Candida pseudojiufengensis]|uniref:pso2 n=1 Tax=Candida pseudojiufengensis TaxID=497109 RepID=UPI0022248D76|nr:pso2 [Candida pseudojiufengensis]KAI5959554.1 pso2 [Candida pseudojiufengensis]